MEIRLKHLHPGAHLPMRATSGSAGLDLCACLTQNGLTLAPMERVLIPTGIAIELPGKNYVALVFARSGLALHKGLAMANGVGVIDSDYRGELQVPMVNLSGSPITIENGERVAQLLVVPVELPDITVTEVLSGTARGAGGFGSTGAE